uniref:Ubiquitin-like domain-containing protein n=1 Tax=Spongospora subterranea TaxID=70186 RepID=A0A0H5RCB5_9EUKA|eukprot:CRZ11678.1 hypothetical protein [Spongospora subterranea]
MITSISFNNGHMSPRSIPSSIESSSDEEDFEEMVRLGNSRPIVRPNRPAENCVTLMRAAQLAQASGANNQSKEKLRQVTACDLLKAAKMAQAAGGSPKMSGQPDVWNETFRQPCIPTASLTSHSIQAPTPSTDSFRHSPNTNIPGNVSEDIFHLEKAFQTLDSMTLVNRLTRIDGIDPETALHVVYEYFRFLSLIIRCNDWHVTRVRPSPLVDLAWRHHILDTNRYSLDCQAICGRFIHYCPDADMDDFSSSRIRYMQTTSLYNRVFGDIPSTIWPAAFQLYPYEQRETHETRNQSPPDTFNAPNHDIIELICKFPTGPPVTIFVESEGLVDQIFRVINCWGGVRKETHVALLDNEVLDVNQHFKDYGVTSGSVIDIVFSGSGR